MAGIKETKEVVDLAMALVKAGAMSWEDGKVSVEDLANLVEVLPYLSPALKDISQVPAELADLDSQEASELVVHVMAKLAIDDEKARKVIGAALGAAHANYLLYLALK